MTTARLLALLLVHLVASTTSLPTLYEHYTGEGIKAGISADQPRFTLNEKNISLYSGTIHYFRVHPDYWRDRLRKLRASGLLAVETYVPWNLHEPESGRYDFGSGNTDFESFLDIARYVKIAQEEDLLVIVRPGPYICAEWEFGGLPSWLLREDGLQVRSSDPKFMVHVRSYYEELLKILTPLQFTRGGPIVAFQIENEYGSTFANDINYLTELKSILVENGVVELLFTSDGPDLLAYGTLPDVLATVNLNSDPVGAFAKLEKHQPGKPLMVMEYWSGWFDHWTEKHSTVSSITFHLNLARIVAYPGSVNLYMFHGGTNWGFLNGANMAYGSLDNGGLQPTTTSYDYDAPLSENGDYSRKYDSIKQVIDRHSDVQLLTPEKPELTPRIAYNDSEIAGQLSLEQILNSADFKLESETLMSMEMLPINNGSGQSYGYTVYRQQVTIPPNSVLKIEGRVCDTVMVLVNGRLASKVLETAEDLNDFGYWKFKDSTLELGAGKYENATLTLVVENWGRNNFGFLTQFNQKKGLWQGEVLLNGNVLRNWTIFPLEFKRPWTTSLRGWEKPSYPIGPTLYKTSIYVEGTPRDTYVDLREWNKGIVIVNGFVLSRYLKLGPQQTSYLPAPLLKSGVNDILVFEHFVPNKLVKFAKDPIYKTAA